VNRILQGLSVLVLTLFAVIWIWIGVRLVAFSPTGETPILLFTDAQVTVAGFLASAIGAGTASVLGVEIQKVAQEPKTVGALINQAATSSKLLVAGILLYACVGAFVLIAWVFGPEDSPDVAAAFSLGVLGWLAGAFAAVFRKSAS
jgi:hypothetical protein